MGAVGFFIHINFGGRDTGFKECHPIKCSEKTTGGVEMLLKQPSYHYNYDMLRFALKEYYHSSQLS